MSSWLFPQTEGPRDDESARPELHPSPAEALAAAAEQQARQEQERELVFQLGERNLLQDISTQQPGREAVSVTKRGRGRPPGSRNRPLDSETHVKGLRDRPATTQEHEDGRVPPEQESPSPVQRGPGQPPVIKNQTNQEGTPVKKPRGRPAGSKTQKRNGELLEEESEVLLKTSTACTKHEVVHRVKTTKVAVMKKRLAVLKLQQQLAVAELQLAEAELALENFS